MNRSLVIAATAVVAGSALLTACGGSKSSDSSGGTAVTATVAGGSVTASTGGKATVQVAGKDLAGLDLNSVTCAKAMGKITIGSGAIGGQQGVGVVLSDGNPPTVLSLGMVVDGTSLAVGGGQGSATVKVDGSTYTITGQAAGADMKNPMAGMISKNFEIKVTCG